MTKDDCYYDAENERIMQFKGWEGQEDLPVDLGTSEMLFEDFMTKEQFAIMEYEIAQPWVYMNEMEVIAWVAK